ncbi:hypothetical protein AWC38_SpisGene14198 [Stylophora pistillata]|uniref:Uncharacterized protein n=1 Tax=Stylophora pistillata TaxID=50429 RepID=A0A2B4RYJ6_STYPI|nr:hypothetical protein AWC38_SpisGene14198 [Stylophora pistillata]
MATAEIKVKQLTLKGTVKKGGVFKTTGAEAAIFENEDHDPKALPKRLRDFAGESLEFEQSNAVDGRLPIIPKPLPGTSHEAEVNHGTVLSTNVTQQKLLNLHRHYDRPNDPSHSKSLRVLMVILYTGLIGLQCLNRPFMMQIFPLNGRTQHPQNSVIGIAKTAIEGYGYSGDSYYEALKELESRFGKPSLVVKVTMDRLRKTAHVQNDKPHEVRNLCDIMSTTVWTFKKFGYESVLQAEANVSLAVDELCQELKIKWKDNSYQFGKA